MNRRDFIDGTLVYGSLVCSTLAANAVRAAAPHRRIRIGQIGTAHSHAAGKMEALRRLSDVYEVVGFAEQDAKLADRARRHAAYRDLPLLQEEALIATPDLAAVAIETRMEDAPAAALRSIRAGKHIHLDKPGALDHASFKALRLEAEERGLTVQMGYMLRYNPAFELLFRAVREGWLGEITEIDAAMGKLADDATRKTIGALPGGGMFELACHVIDAAITLLGKPESVTAFSTPTKQDGVLDNQLAVLRYPQATATIRCNHADPFGGPRRRFAVAGTRGSLEIQPLESGQITLRLTEPHEPWKRGTQQAALPVPQGRYDGEFSDLAKVIRGEKALAWSAGHDIAVHETVLLASASNVGSPPSQP